MPPPSAAAIGSVSLGFRAEAEKHLVLCLSQELERLGLLEVGRLIATHVGLPSQRQLPRS